MLPASCEAGLLSLPACPKERSAVRVLGICTWSQRQELCGEGSECLQNAARQGELDFKLRVHVFIGIFYALSSFYAEYIEGGEIIASGMPQGWLEKP